MKKKSENSDTPEVGFSSDSKLRKSTTTKSPNILKNLTGTASKTSSVPQVLSYSKIDHSSSTSIQPQSPHSTAKPIFHKITTFKTWSNLFDSMHNHTCMLGVKLNLAKPPKYSQMIANYIESAKNKVLILGS